MTIDQISYKLPGATWTLVFSPAALETIQKRAQHGRWSKESVGQLYSRDLTGQVIVVDEATVLTPTWASWAKVRFDVKRAMQERQIMFEHGLHCIGLWHTHAEPCPEPSALDRNLARDHALAAQSQLAGIVFAIMGTLPLLKGLKVWIDNGHQLLAAESLEEAEGGRIDGDV
jgi:hypothetical protein